MRPLECQLEDRFNTLEKIHDTLMSLETEEIPQTVLQDLGIEFNPLNIDTGVTHSSVLPYFLPRTNFPSCRDMKREIDAVWRNGLRIDERTESFSSSFESSFLLSLHNHSFLKETLYPDFRNPPKRPAPTYGWMSLSPSQRMKEKGLQIQYFKYGKSEDEDSQDEDEFFVFPSHHFRLFYHFGSDTCSTSGNPLGDPLKIGLDDSPINRRTCSSHETAQVIIRRALMKYPSVTELIVLLKLILHGVGRQIEELKQLQSKGLEHFHHILPRLIIALDKHCHARVLYAYFDDEKLKVQFTSALDFEKFDFEQFRRKRRLSPGIKYIESMDWSHYQDMLDSLLKWTWPVVQGDSSE